MQLTINNQSHTFIPIQAFRAKWKLPLGFQLTYFESKEWEGLGSLEGAGHALAAVRRRVMAAVQPQIALSNLMSTVDELTSTFRHELEAVNMQIGLRPVEVDFAVSGFYDVLDSVAYHLIQLVHAHQGNLAQIRSHFDFEAIYRAWLDDSVRISATTHVYKHKDTQFEVRVIYNAYGRIGLEVKVANELHYVTDMHLACPASSYMRDLCGEVAQALCRALTT